MLKKMLIKLDRRLSAMLILDFIKIENDEGDIFIEDSGCGEFVVKQDDNETCYCDDIFVGTLDEVVSFVNAM